MSILDHYTLEPITFNEAISMILDAIKEYRRLVIVYSGLERRVDPYVFGYSSTGNPLFKCFQLEGGSLSKNRPGWRVFQVFKLDQITEEVDEKRRPVYFEPLWGDPALTNPWIFQVAKQI
jgi:hypothetical protein